MVIVAGTVIFFVRWTYMYANFTLFLILRLFWLPILTTSVRIDTSNFFWILVVFGLIFYCANEFIKVGLSNLPFVPTLGVWVSSDQNLTCTWQWGNWKEYQLTPWSLHPKFQAWLQSPASFHFMTSDRFQHLQVICSMKSTAILHQKSIKVNFTYYI